MQAHLLHSVESVNSSPFDKGFSFDFSASIGEGGGYRPTPYSLEPPCPCLPPCLSPCRCWESDSGVGGEEHPPDDTDRKSLSKSDRFLHLESISNVESEFSLHNVLEEFTCLRVAPIEGTAVPPAKSSPTQNFGSFKSQKVLSGSSSQNHCFDGAVLSIGLAQALDHSTNTMVSSTANGAVLSPGLAQALDHSSNTLSNTANGQRCFIY